MTDNVLAKVQFEGAQKALAHYIEGKLQYAANNIKSSLDYDDLRNLATELDKAELNIGLAKSAYKEYQENKLRGFLQLD